MRCPDAVCAQYRRPAGVTNRFQVCEYSVELSEPNRSRNLFAKDCVRATLADEPKPRRPKMSLVSAAALLSGGGEGLAGTGAGPNRSSWIPSGKLEGVSPAADPGEEMAVAVAGKSVGSDIEDAALIDFPLRQMPFGDELSEPRRSERVVVVVPGHRRIASSRPAHELQGRTTIGVA